MSERDLEAIAAGVAAYAMGDDDGPRSPPRAGTPLDGRTPSSSQSPKGKKDGKKGRKKPTAPAVTGKGKGKGKGKGYPGMAHAPVAFPGGRPPFAPHAMPFPMMPGMPMPGMPGFPMMPNPEMLQALLAAKGKGKGKGKGGMPEGLFPGFPMPMGMPAMGGLPPALDRHTLKLRIRQQIEYYFSKENLLKDVYLRQQMDVDGWVPLETLAGFTRLKTLLLCTNDPTLLMIALVESEFVDVDVAKKKVRAKDNHEMWLLPKAGDAPDDAGPSSPAGKEAPATATPASPAKGAPPGLPAPSPGLPAPPGL